MTIIDNTLTDNQINSIYVNLIGDFNGNATKYEMEVAVVNLMNAENLTLQDCFDEMEIMGVEY